MTSEQHQFVQLFIASSAFRLTVTDDMTVAALNECSVLFWLTAGIAKIVRPTVDKPGTVTWYSDTTEYDRDDVKKSRVEPRAYSYR